MAVQVSDLSRLEAAFLLRPFHYDVIVFLSVHFAMSFMAKTVTST